MNRDARNRIQTIRPGQLVPHLQTTSPRSFIHYRAKRDVKCMKPRLNAIEIILRSFIHYRVWNSGRVVWGELSRERVVWLVSEFGTHSGDWKPSSECSINHSNWPKAFILARVAGGMRVFALFFKAKIRICAFIGFGILFYHQPRICQAVFHWNSFVRVNICSVNWTYLSPSSEGKG